MARILNGAPVSKAITERSKLEVEDLSLKGITPTLAILRVGERPDDISYENTAIRRAQNTSVAVRSVVLPEDVPEKAFFEELEKLNNDDSVHGILMFRPLPKHIDGEKARLMLNPLKDIDGCTDGSLAGVFTNSGYGFPPCTAQAAIEILDYYDYDCKGLNATIVGRSLVVGRPVAMMLMHKNATITICHTKTTDLAAKTKAADILIVCSGQMESIGADYVTENQVVIDVGIGWSEEKGKLCGDVVFDDAEPIVGAVTPVPGGVGTVTTSILVSHVVEAAKRTLK